MSDIEKQHSTRVEQIALRDRDGYLLDASRAGTKEGLQLSRDQQTILIPQPSADPHDPLNWSQGRKNLVLFIISATALLPDYGSATGAVTLIPQAQIWHMSPDEVNHSQVGNLFMLGAGGVIVVMLAAFFGRLPVFFWFTTFAFLTAIWCAAATSFESFFAARVLNGLFATVAQGGGLMLIKDMFFLHEHARKINVWSAFITVSPYLGPLLAAFMITKLSWHWPFWIYTIETGLCLTGIILFLDETYYDRRIPIDKQPARQSRFMRLIGVEQYRSRHLRNSFLQALMRSVKVILKPTVFISTIYFLFTFAWVVGINTTLSIFIGPLYGFGPKQIGFLYFAPVIAAILGEIVGHWLHDFIAKIYMRRNNGTLDPEARLLAIYVSTPFMLAGLVAVGFCLQNGYHYMVTAVTWGLYVFGIMITTVALNAYNLEAYPEASGEVAAWINFARTTGGFIVSYFQVRWALAMGPQRSFGVQAGVTAAVFFLIVFLSLFGGRLRAWSGPLRFKTA
ncbi:MAG: hypothetical protein L6R41_006783 [Letrouitia leprolyta]|nr:MAG: hypothetical protein L6R41_006783 [Letrouitia leprolyta]